MRLRTLSKLGATLVATISAVVLTATPASASHEDWIITQYTSSGEIFSRTRYDHEFCGDANHEELTVYDSVASGFGTEAHVYIRYSAIYEWQRVAVLRVNDGFGNKCVPIAEEMQVKISSWKYNGSDKWDRKSIFAWS